MKTVNYDDIDDCINLLFKYLYSGNNLYESRQISTKITDDLIIKKDDTYNYDKVLKKVEFKSSKDDIFIFKRSSNNSHATNVNILRYTSNNISEISNHLKLAYVLSSNCMYKGLNTILCHLVNFDIKGKDIKKVNKAIYKTLANSGDNDDNDIDDYSYSVQVTEHYYHQLTLDDYINSNINDMTEYDFKYMIFIVLATLATISSYYPMFVHNRLNLSSILIYVKKSNLMNFSLSGKNYSVKGNFEIKLTNFYNSCISNSKGEDNNKSFIDIHEFLSRIYLKIINNDRNKFSNIINFIESVIPSEFMVKDIKTYKKIDIDIFNKQNNIVITPLTIISKNNFFVEFINTNNNMDITVSSTENSPLQYSDNPKTSKGMRKINVYDNSFDNMGDEGIFSDKYEKQCYDEFMNSNDNSDNMSAGLELFQEESLSTIEDVLNNIKNDYDAVGKQYTELSSNNGNVVFSNSSFDSNSDDFEMYGGGRKTRKINRKKNDDNSETFGFEDMRNETIASEHYDSKNKDDEMFEFIKFMKNRSNENNNVGKMVNTGMNVGDKKKRRRRRREHKNSHSNHMQQNILNQLPEGYSGAVPEHLMNSMQEQGRGNNIDPSTFQQVPQNGKITEVFGKPDAHFSGQQEPTHMNNANGFGASNMMMPQNPNMMMPQNPNMMMQQDPSQNMMMQQAQMNPNMMMQPNPNMMMQQNPMMMQQNPTMSDTMMSANNPIGMQMGGDYDKLSNKNKKDDFFF